jgi:hypothetical protein
MRGDGNKSSRYLKEGAQSQNGRLITGLKNQSWKFSDITQCLCANMQRGARATLEERGLLTPRQTHANGAEWIFWAEEPEANGKK